MTWLRTFDIFAIRAPRGHEAPVPGDLGAPKRSSAPARAAEAASRPSFPWSRWRP